MGEAKKYYWLKLRKDFFKRHDISILEGMENGECIVLFFLKLMTESIDHDGRLRFSDEIPYTETMLASITHTAPDLVAYAMDMLKDLGLVEILEDKTIHLPMVEKMIGSTADNDNARRQQRFRDRHKEPESNDGVTDAVTKSNAGVTERNAGVTERNVTEHNASVTKSNESIEIRDKSIEIDKESVITPPAKTKPERNIIPPTVDMVKAYCEQRKNGIDAQRFIDYYSTRGWMLGKSKMKDWQAAVRTWEGNQKVGKKQNSMTQMMTTPTTDDDLAELERRLIAN